MPRSLAITRTCLLLAFLDGGEVPILARLFAVVLERGERVRVELSVAHGERLGSLGVRHDGGS